MHRLALVVLFAVACGGDDGAKAQDAAQDTCVALASLAPGGQAAEAGPDDVRRALQDAAASADTAAKSNEEFESLVTAVQVVSAAYSRAGYEVDALPRDSADIARAAADACRVQVDDNQRPLPTSRP